MRHEPRALKRRHQGLAVDFRLKDIDACKYDGHHCTETQNPFELPSAINYEADDCDKERIPESGLSLSTHRRALKRGPEADYEAKEDQGSENRSHYSLSPALLLPGESGAADPAKGSSYGKPYETIPTYHILSSFLRLYPAVRAMNTPALRISHRPILIAGYHPSLTHSKMLIELSAPRFLS